MKVSLRNEVPAILIVSIEGRLASEQDKATLRDAVEPRLTDAVKYLIFDLSKVSYMASTVIGAMVGIHQRCSDSSIHMCLVGLTGSIKELVCIPRLTEVWEVYDSIDEALMAALSGLSADLEQLMLEQVTANAQLRTGDELDLTEITGRNLKPLTEYSDYARCRLEGNAQHRDDRPPSVEPLPMLVMQQIQSNSLPAQKLPGLAAGSPARCVDAWC